MKTTLSVLFCLASATLLSACQGPADSLLDCPSGDENCQEASTKNEQGRLEMPPLSLDSDESLQTMEGWLQAAQLEAEDGIPRLAAWTAHGLNLLPYTVKDGRVIVGGDVDMGPISVLESARDRGVALQEVWFPEGHIPWYTNGISTAQLSKIEAGLKILAEHTPLTFEKVSSSDDVRALEFKGTTGCSSFYGGLTYDYWNDDDAQPVLRLCQDNGARSVSTVLHEMGHALGFPHEFQREDRDDHVDVCFNLDPFNYAKMGDVSNFDASEQIIRTALNEYGRLDCLVNVAGILRDRMVFNMTEAEWDAVIAVHLKGTFNTTKFASIYWRTERQGDYRLINFTSVSGLSGAPGQPNYAAAKLGIVGFTYSCANALGRYGVTSNAISPGAGTRMGGTIPTDRRRALGANPNRNEDEMSPNNVAPPVVYLCSKDSGWLNGQVIGASGYQVSLFNQPEPIRTLQGKESWTIDDMWTHMEKQFKSAVDHTTIYSARAREEQGN